MTAERMIRKLQVSRGTVRNMYGVIFFRAVSFTYVKMSGISRVLSILITCKDFVLPLIDGLFTSDKQLKENQELVRANRIRKVVN